MSKQEEIREGVDRIVCEFIDPNIPYGEGADVLYYWSGQETQKIIDYLHSKGVVIQVERELPELSVFDAKQTNGNWQIFRKATKEDMAGYTAVEPLIEEK